MQKLIPPFLLLLAALIMTVLHFVYPVYIIIQQPFTFIGAAFIVLGIVMARTVRKNFDKVNTEIHTFKKPRHLVTSGLFQFSRNPIYLGFTIALAGFCILLGSVTPIIILLLFIFITDRWYIPFEEKNLEEQFGEEYKKYKTKVRRWI